MRLPAVLALLGVSLPGSWAADRPNILWIVFEDISPDIGAYGDKYAATPNLDRLAEESIRYTRAFSNSGVCAPARSTLIAGVYPPAIGTHHMRSRGVPPAHIRGFTDMAARGRLLHVQSCEDRLQLESSGIDLGRHQPRLARRRLAQTRQEAFFHGSEYH